MFSWCSIVAPAAHHQHLAAKKGSSFISLISSLTGLGQWDSQYGGQLCLNSYFRAQRLYAGRM
nr:hypothetical protein Iba_chr01dCG1720 [Ipomoea batatas]GME18908.1 hypothetical protein Iba_scaffold21579CG0010 [Ipomoea batatas]